MYLSQLQTVQLRLDPRHHPARRQKPQQRQDQHGQQDQRNQNISQISQVSIPENPRADLSARGTTSIIAG
jgi:hypothetical protein